MSEVSDKVVLLADGKLSSKEIAAVVGVSPRYVRKIMQTKNLPRLPQGGPVGEENGQFVSGRRVTQTGYAKITPPLGHPTACPRAGRNLGYMLEHRYVAEQKLGRLLLPEEIVDHIDGLTLHNAPENLRVFPNNGVHLAHTLAGKLPQWSAEGRRNMKTKRRQDEPFQPVDTHRRRTKAGAVRLRQILLLALKLGLDSPFLLGTHRHTKKAHIDMTSRPKIQRALGDLCQKWEWAQTQ